MFPLCWIFVAAEWLRCNICFSSCAGGSSNEEEEPEQKKRKEQQEYIQSEEFQKLLNAKSCHSGILQAVRPHHDSFMTH